MVSLRAIRMYVTLCLCPVMATAAQAANLCATDNAGGTILLSTDTALTPNAVIGLHGWLSRTGGFIPLFGTAVVNAKGTGMKIGLQGLNDIQTRHQHLGISITTDLTLNGSGTFEDINDSTVRPFQYDIISVTWTTLDPCPAGP